MLSLKSLEEKLNYKFKNKNLLTQALTHKSYDYEVGESKSEGDPRHNEKLEFLGDAVLDLALSDLLMLSYPQFSEGHLSKMRASLVNESLLADMARELNMSECLLLGKGENRSGGAQKPRLLASAFEALLGAIYLDSGFVVAKEVISKIFASQIENLDMDVFYATDYKTRLQELSQKLWKTTPVYIVLQASGPDHDKSFEVTIEISGARKGQAWGKSKKLAEQNAARCVLESLSE